MTEREEDEFADLSGEQEETVRQAREWVQAMVKEAWKSDLHLMRVVVLRRTPRRALRPRRQRRTL
jgi:hypothetical protein